LEGNLSFLKYEKNPIHFCKDMFRDNEGELKDCYKFYYSGITTDHDIYIFDELTDEFIEAENAEDTFNGVRMKKEDGNLYFNVKDLIALGIVDS
jgi:hypothetical protein